VGKCSVVGSKPEMLFGNYVKYNKEDPGLLSS